MNKNKDSDKFYFKIELFDYIFLNHRKTSINKKLILNILSILYLNMHTNHI